MRYSLQCKNYEVDIKLQGRQAKCYLQMANYNTTWFALILKYDWSHGSVTLVSRPNKISVKYL